MDPNLFDIMFNDIDSLLPSDSKIALKDSTVDVSESLGPVEGPGGGMDDLIPAVIEADANSPAQPARLSAGEFVIPEFVVSFLGDGDVNQGSELLSLLQTDPDTLDEFKGFLQSKKTKETED